MNVINRNIIPYYINIDSGMKNVGNIITKDKCILDYQEIKFTTNNNLIFIKHKDHSYKSGDIISITNFNSPYDFLNIYDDNNNLIFDVPNGSDFMKIMYPHGININTEQHYFSFKHEYYEIEIQGIKGTKDNNNKRTLCGFPISVLNSKHKILFELDPQNYNHLNLPSSYYYPGANHFFIKFNTVSWRNEHKKCKYSSDNNDNETNNYDCSNNNISNDYDSGFNANHYKIKPQLFKLIRHYVAGINIDSLISLQEGAIIKSCNSNGYYISLCDCLPIYDECYLAKQLCVSKIISTTRCGQVNNYVINLGKTYNNIYSVKLCSTEFPNMKNRIFIDDCNLCWMNYEDSYLNKITIPTGNYSYEELAHALTELTRNSPHANNGCYTNYLQCQVEHNLDNKYMSIKSFRSIELYKPLKYVDKKVLIHHCDHSAKVGMIIKLESCESSVVVDSLIVIMNRYYVISCIIDQDTYEINLTDNKHNYLLTPPSNEILVPGYIKILFPEMICIQYDKCKTFCDLIGITSNHCNKPSTCITSKYFNNNFDYFYMIIKPFQTFDLNNPNIYSPFAKIQTGTNDWNGCSQVLYNTFVDIPKIYYDPVKSISSLEVSFVSPCGKPYNFGNLNHSFTLEFLTIDDSPVESLLNPNTLKSYGAPVQIQ